MSRYFKAKITKNRQLNQKNHILCIEPLESIIKPAPGQFYMIAVNNTYDPLLKRPFSYFKTTTEGIHFLYAVRGKGTSLMKDLKQGNIINLVGPLGSGYPKPKSKSIPLLIAGGTGVASIFSFASEISHEAYFIQGARCKDEILLTDELNQLKTKPIMCTSCTDDGSFGHEGTVIDVLKTFLASDSLNVGSCLIYACGPGAMLESLARIAHDYSMKGYVSLEENMACGFGACLSCAVKTIHGYKRVCKEGPVFPIEDIIW